MGNQFASADHVRRAKELVDAGLIGDVTEVKTWTNRPVWPQVSLPLLVNLKSERT